MLQHTFAKSAHGSAMRWKNRGCQLNRWPEQGTGQTAPALSACMPGDLLKLLLILAGLLVVYGLILGRGVRGRVGRPPRGIATRYADPTGHGPAAVFLATLALGVFNSGSSPGVDGAQGATLGAVLGILLTVTATRGLTSATLSVLGVVAATVEGFRFIANPDQGALGYTYRAALVLLTISCFVLGALIFHRASALKSARGLALFGLIDIATFFAGPAGAHLYLLAAGQHVIYICTACVVAMGLGWAASEFTLSLAAIGVAFTSFGLGLVGWGAIAGPGFVGVVSALTVYMIVRIVLNSTRSRAG